MRGLYDLCGAEHLKITVNGIRSQRKCEISLGRVPSLVKKKKLG